MVYLEPDSALSSPAVDILTIRYSSQVELHWTRVVDIGSRAVCDGGASGDAESRLGRAVGRLEAPDLLRVYTVDEAVILPVIRLANILPVGSCSAVCPHLGERVVSTGADSNGEKERDGGKHGGQRVNLSSWLDRELETRMLNLFNIDI